MIDYINKDTNEKVHEPYKKDDLSNGDKDSVDSPKVDGCTLVDKNDSTVDYTIDSIRKELDIINKWYE